MKTSESITKLAQALIKAQSEITFAVKDSENPFFKSKYADLPSVIDAVKPALNSNGIVFIQSPSPASEGLVALTTRLIHESGEWIEDTAVAPMVKNDPQAYGSAITYLRRYSLAAITGLYQDDDDANHATHSAKPVKSETLTEGMIKGIQKIADDRGVSTMEICETAKVDSLSEIEQSRLSGLTTWLMKKPVLEGK